MSTLVERLREQLRKEFIIYNPRPEAAEELHAKLLAVVEAAEQCKWINECRCDKMWLVYKRHEPNALCGELDPLVEALAELNKLVSNQKDSISENKKGE